MIEVASLAHFENYSLLKLLWVCLLLVTSYQITKQSSLLPTAILQSCTTGHPSLASHCCTLPLLPFTELVCTLLFFIALGLNSSNLPVSWSTFLLVCHCHGLPSHGWPDLQNVVICWDPESQDPHILQVIGWPSSWSDFLLVCLCHSLPSSWSAFLLVCLRNGLPPHGWPSSWSAFVIVLPSS